MPVAQMDSQKVKQAVQRGYGPVDSGGGADLRQLVLVGPRGGLVQGSAVQPGGETRRLPPVFLNGRHAFFSCLEPGGKGRHVDSCHA